MLCHACRVHLRRDFPYCLRCGTPRRGVQIADYRPPRLERVAVEDAAEPAAVTKPVTTIGRSPRNDVVLADPSVSRRHARVVRQRDGFVLEDLDSLNGTAVLDGAGTAHQCNGGPVRLGDGALIQVGDVQLRFVQPRPTAVGSKTVLRGTEFTILSDPDEAPEAPAAEHPLSARPRKRSGWALKRVPEASPPRCWVLRNTRTGTYLQLDDREVFLWELLDGTNTIRDLLYAYAQKFHELALPRIETTLRTFASAGLIRGLPGQPEEAPRSAWRTAVRALVRLELSIHGLDGLVERAYRRFGWWLFTKPAVLLAWLLVPAGLAGFWQAQRHERLLDVGGSGPVGLAVAALAFLVALVAHESVHALAVKSYGRQVRRGGFMLTMGMPFAFVDTSDMWFGHRWSRIVVSLSGPLVTADIAGACALIAAYAPKPVVAGICFQIAFGLYLNTLYNFNPLLPMDGYHALADALRMPRLREQAMEYFRRGLWRDLTSRTRIGYRQLALAGYGMAALLATYLFLILALLAWRSRFEGLVRRHLDHPWDTAVIAVAIALIIFPVWYPSAMRLARRLRHRAS